MKKPKVSVIITTKNEEAVIENLLKSLKRQTYRPLEILLVDNNSTDRTKAIARRYTPLIFNAGPERSRQRNFGGRKATGKYLLILDADMELEPKVVEESVLVAEANPQIKAVVVPERSFGQGFWARCKALERECYLGDEKIEAARFFDKKAFWEFGGYDEKITGPEDWDLPLRIRTKYRGGRSASFVNHNEKRLSLLKIMKKKYYYAQNFALYRKKHPQISWYQSLLIFRTAFYRNWRKLFAHPVTALGMVFMLCCEMLAGGLGYFLSLIRR